MGKSGSGTSFYQRWRRLIQAGGIATVGGLVGLLTVLIGTVSMTFLEVLVSTTVTIYGFLLIGVIFIYEQQRRSWPVIWMIDDVERKALRWGLSVGVGTGAAGLIFGITLLAVGRTQERQLWQALNGSSEAANEFTAILTSLSWLVAPLLFSSIAALGYAVRRILVLLAPGSIADRVLGVARRAAQENRDEDVRMWVEMLQRLTVEHLISRNIDDFETYVRSLSALAASPPGLVSSRRGGALLAELAVDSLITVCDRAGVERNPRALAIGAAISIVTESDAMGDVSLASREALAERVASMLDAVLSTERPSATLVRLLLQLGLVLSSSPSNRSGLLVDTLRRAIAINNPADVWHAVSRVLAEEVAGESSTLDALEVAQAVQTLSMQPAAVEAAVRSRLGASDQRSQAQRITDLFDDLGIGPTSSRALKSEKLPKPIVEATLGAFAWMLAEAPGHESLDPQVRRCLAHEFALLWMDMKADLQDENQLPEALHAIVARLSPRDWLYVRFVTGVERNRKPGKRGARSGVPTFTPRNFCRNHSPEKDAVHAAVCMVIDTYPDPEETSIAVRLVRGMLYSDDLKGMMALPTFVWIRKAVEKLSTAGRDARIEAFASPGCFVDISERATEPLFFNRGLADCQEICLGEIDVALQKLAGSILPSRQGNRLAPDLQRLIESLTIVTFALAVSLDDADGLTMVGRLAEALPEFATPFSRQGNGMTSNEMKRLANDAMWLTNIVMDLPIRVAPRRAGVRGVLNDAAIGFGGLRGSTYVILPDGSRALRLRDVWKLAALRSALHGIRDLSLAQSEADSSAEFIEVASELDEAVQLGGRMEVDGRRAPDRIDEILAEAVVSLRHHFLWYWLKATERLDWNGLGAVAWAEATDRLSASDKDLEPTGVIGLMEQMLNNLDEDRMPTAARLFLARILGDDLPDLNHIDNRAIPPERVIKVILNALMTVVHERVYDKDVHVRAMRACIDWASRTKHHAFVQQLARRLAGRSEHSPLLIALQRTVEEMPHLRLWRWNEWRELTTLDVRKVSIRHNQQRELLRLGVDTVVSATVISVEENYAFVQPHGQSVAHILPNSEASWTFIPDLRQVLNVDDSITLQVVRSSRTDDAALNAESELVLSRKPLVENVRPAVRAAYHAGTRQAAKFLGRGAANGVASVLLTDFEGWVVARLIGVNPDSLPREGSDMRVVLDRVTEFGDRQRITARV